MGTEEPIDHESLTDREREILGLIADGLTNQQIADQLYLTLDTVKWYNKQSYQKLRVRSRTQAVARARELGLLAAPPPATKHNLPPQNTLFIGREQELADIQARLADPTCRLLTLYGPGGIGKTRLAIEAARQQIAAFPDGVYFVPFASVESPAFVAQTLAEGLGLALTNQRDPLEQVLNYLRGKTLLLLIDNFEHLLDSAPLLLDLISKTRQARLLVTSRERLHLKEEWLFDVQGLRYPLRDAPEDASDSPAHYESVQLFLQTAQRVQSGFSLDADDPKHVVHICRLVGGMPLGIELAASWVRVLPCADIAREIERGLDILSTTLRDIPQRHQSIQAVLDHSWKLLSPTEQAVFSKLTVFSGSFQRDAAEAVTEASLTTLLELLDKSFLQRVGQDRFAIHELLKQFGSDKLRSNPDTWTATRLRHCRYFAAYFHKYINMPDVLQHLEAIEIEFDDIQIAWRFAVESGQLDEIQGFARTLWSYCRLVSWYRAGSDAIALYHQALACFENAAEYPGRSKTMACLCESLGSLYALKSMYEEAMQFYEQALSYTPELDFIERGRTLRQIGDVWVMMNEHAEGHATYLQAESVLEQVEQRDAAWWIEWTHVQTERMMLYYWANRLEDMMDLDDKIRSLIDQHGLLTHRVRYLNALGMMALRRDRYFNSQDAIDYSGQALALSIESGNLSEIAWCHFTHGFGLLWSSRLDEAEQHMLISQAMTEENGDLSLLARALTYLTVVYRKRGDSSRVQEYATFDLKIAREAQMPQYTGMSRAQYAWLAWRAGDVAEAKRQAEAAIDDWGGLGNAQSVVPFRWLALFPLMAVALREEDPEQAVQWAAYLITPPQQRLPDDLADLLEQAVAAWKNEQSTVANDLLHQALQKAHALDYV